MQYIAETREFQIKEKTVVSIGKFDGLHRGHQKLMHEMLKWKEQGFKIAVFTFATPPGTLVKGKMQTMIMTNPEREMLLERAGVDYIVEYPFDEEVCHMAPEKFVSDILVGHMNAGVIVSGPDCHFGYLPLRPGIRDQYLQLLRNPVQHRSRRSDPRRAFKIHLDPRRRIGCDCFDHGVYLWEFEEAGWEIKFFQPKLT